MTAFMSRDSLAVMEGVMSHRAEFPGLSLDIRGIFDRYSAQFQPETGMAVVQSAASLGVAWQKVKDVYNDLKGELVRVYDPESVGDDDAYTEYKCGTPAKFENMTVEIPLQAAT